MMCERCEAKLDSGAVPIPGKTYWCNVCMAKDLEAGMVPGPETDNIMVANRLKP